MDLKKYIYAHCIAPKKVRIYDAISQQYVWREIPCGKCLHCRNTHVNQWCTRLFAAKKYHLYTYFISLDYAPFKESDPIACQLAVETAACYHDINKNHSYGLHPLVLCKNHLQDYFKRLRKSLGFKIQYFACGEYGSHANGRGYGRPHYHCVIFSDFPITQKQFADSWCVNGYNIGRVDYVDISTNNANDLDEINKIFKYVCKYIQKGSFDFEELATIDYHRAYFKSLEQTYIKADTLFPERVLITDVMQLKFDWEQYIKLHSPFVVCSRRPSIGFEYYKENLERFSKLDFRLFGLPEGCIFPNYFKRKVKEGLCPFKSIGEVSCLPSSSSRIGNILDVLRAVYDSTHDFADFSEKCANYWCTDRLESGLMVLRHYVNGDVAATLPYYQFHLYDNVNKFFYQFVGDSYRIWAKLKGNYEYFDTLSINEVIDEVSPHFDNLIYKYYMPLNFKTQISNKQLLDTINALYTLKYEYDSNGVYCEISPFQQFKRDAYSIYRDECDKLYKTKMLMSNSKQNL